MLVLSRRAGEKIVFPNIDVTVELVRINGSVAKIGVSAPPCLKILRHELHEQGPGASTVLPAPSISQHELNNRLNRLTLAMHLFHRQRDSGMAKEAEETLSILFEGLKSLDQVWSTAKCAPVPSRPTPSAFRTLLVEDDANERVLLAELLSMNGCECATAVDGHEALEYLRNNQQPDVVLLDMHMPRCDGPNTLRAIRGERRLADIRVFGVSGTSPQDLGIAIGPGGVDGWFPKPLNPATLWQAVQKSVVSSGSIT